MAQNQSAGEGVTGCGSVSKVALRDHFWVVSVMVTSFANTKKEREAPEVTESKTAVNSIRDIMNMTLQKNLKLWQLLGAYLEEKWQLLPCQKASCHKTSLSFNTLGRNFKISSKGKNQFPFQIKIQFNDSYSCRHCLFAASIWTHMATKINRKCLKFITKSCQHERNHTRWGVRA